MNKNRGFTLVELLVVIAIIAILSVLVVPNVIKVNQNAKTRMYQEKKEMIINAAELYAKNNPDIFMGSNEVDVPIAVLLQENYLTSDDKEKCGSDYTEIGCIKNPINGEILNEKVVTLTKKDIGVVGSFDNEDGSTLAGSDSELLVKKVCDGFGKSFSGKHEKGDCECDSTGKKLVLKDGTNVKYCLIVSENKDGSVNNWLRYGSSSANWRVLGLYELSDGSLSAKMITHDTVSVIH